MIFSSRTNWPRRPNRLTELLDARKAGGKLIYDLTIANPTDCGIRYPTEEILAALSNPQSLGYKPDPRGLLSARKSISDYYRNKNLDVDPANIFLTASTSDAYSAIFKLLCNGNDNVLVPRPSYPLFDFLAQVNDVPLLQYDLRHDGHEWQIDIASIATTITSNTRAIIIVNPHNPTGAFLRQDAHQQIVELARKHDIALIVDEVFIDYAFFDDPRRVGSTACANGTLTFTLNGISKLAGMPQMKIGWLVVGGERLVVREASERLEILCDTFLSVNTPAQVGLPGLIKAGTEVRARILQRIKSNFNLLCNLMINTPCSVLPSEGGWNAILRVPRTKSDEEWALQLLDRTGVYLYPGYFFDFEAEGYLVVSLLPEEELFRRAVGEICGFVSV